jgi:hypothetical protein
LSASSQLRDGEPTTLISSNQSPQKKKPASATERERRRRKRERAEESSYGGEKALLFFLFMGGGAFPLSPPSPGSFLGHRGSKVTGDSRYELPVILGLTTGSTLSSSWEQPAVAGSHFPIFFFLFFYFFF